MRPRRRNARRRGLTVAAVLVCLVIIALMSGVLLKIGAAHRERVRSAGLGVQARWLAQAGLARARARLAASPGYAGETWELSASDLGLPAPADGGKAGKAAVVVIAVERPADAPGRRRIHARADVPPDSSHRARHTEQMLIELDTPRTGASR